MTYRNTYEKIKLDNIRYNVEKIINSYPGYKYYIGVVKADCYGHNTNKVVKSIIDGGCNYLAVSSLDEALEVKDYTNSKLGELILEISNEKTDNEQYQKSYENYTKAKGALDVLESETETEYKLTQISNEIDAHVRNIEMVIEQDIHLTTDMELEELKERIDDLKSKEEEYNQLKGFIKTKKSLEGQLESKKEDIDWK